MTEDLPYLAQSQYALLVLLRKWYQKDAEGLTEKWFLIEQVRTMVWKHLSMKEAALPMAGTLNSSWNLRAL